MADPSCTHFISSAVLLARPDREDSVLQAISVMSGVEIHGHRDGRIVIVLEGRSPGMLGDILLSLSTIEGVIAANMVFEQSMSAEEISDDQRIDAA